MKSILYEESPLLGAVVTTLPILLYHYNHHYLTALSIILFIFMLAFYRYSPHDERYHDNQIVSPAEGTITNIKLLNKHLYVSIFLSPFNKHTQIYPVNGTVVHRVYDETGKFGLATTIDKCRNNEKKIHTIQMCSGKLMRVTQIAGFLPRRISSSDDINVDVKAGEYLGIIKFGSRVDILVPVTDTFKLHVVRNQTVNIGDVICTLDF